MLRNHFGRWILFVGLLVFFAACDQTDMPTTSLTQNSVTSLAPPAGETVSGRYIVVLKDDSQLASKTHRQVTEEMSRLEGVDADWQYATALHGFSGTFTDEAIDKVRNDPNVAYVEPDKWVSLPPIIVEGGKGNGNAGKPGSGGTTSPPPQTTPWGITRVGGPGDGTGKTAWIIDTGVDLDHPDLIVDGARSRSFLGGKQANNPDDQNGHGTHVAGTIAAINNPDYVVGVAAGATVVSVRVLDRNGSGWLSDVIEGIDYVAAAGAGGDVANMSLGGGVSTALDDAVVNASALVKFALAAGNESDDANNHSPARANGANIYTVSAINSSDQFASFSNRGNPPIDFAAPGVSVLSLWKNGGTNTISGTSMATPHVAGVLLLGAIHASGTAKGDPDGNPDPIAHR